MKKMVMLKEENTKKHRGASLIYESKKQTTAKLTKARTADRLMLVIFLC